MRERKRDDESGAKGERKERDTQAERERERELRDVTRLQASFLPASFRSVSVLPRESSSWTCRYSRVESRRVYATG